VPLIATMLVPMSFSELYLTLCYTIVRPFSLRLARQRLNISPQYVEMLGHSGIRSHWTHPVLWILRPIGAELTVEDHDQHHYLGKSGVNYGKQSRFWDKMFGTIGPRIETAGM
jgi:sterol desaturase/sphingolipid hydroxylase (fatty acid hydroxylase superfamily)